MPCQNHPCERLPKYYVAHLSAKRVPGCGSSGAGSRFVDREVGLWQEHAEFDSSGLKKIWSCVYSNKKNFFLVSRSALFSFHSSFTPESCLLFSEIFGFQRPSCGCNRHSWTCIRVCLMFHLLLSIISPPANIKKKKISHLPLDWNQGWKLCIKNQIRPSLWRHPTGFNTRSPSVSTFVILSVFIDFTSTAEEMITHHLILPPLKAYSSLTNCITEIKLYASHLSKTELWQTDMIITSPKVFIKSVHNFGFSPHSESNLTLEHHADPRLSLRGCVFTRVRLFVGWFCQQDYTKNYSTDFHEF